MKRQFPAIILAFLFAVLLALPCVQTASASQGDYIAANHTRSNGRPYYIMVDRAQSIVTVYGLDESGYYTVPVKTMICSTGRKGHATPTGTYAIGGKWQWVHMLDNSYGQYVSQIKGNILFHSVCYYKRDPSTLITEEYNGLGAPASLGCVRLQTVDAKWIYDNCASGTKVTVYDGTAPSPLGRPTRLVDHISAEQANGWDPTDPREENPWHAILAAGQEPEAEYYTVPAAWAAENGIADAAAFSPHESCTQAQILTFLWRAAGKPGAEDGQIPDAGGEDRDAVLGAAGEPEAEDEPIPDADEDYRNTVLWAAGRDMINPDDFNPEGPCLRSDAVSFIWKAFGSPEAGSNGFADVDAGADFAAAVSWAVENGITDGTTPTTFSPYEGCTQAQILTFLYRAYQK